MDPIRETKQLPEDDWLGFFATFSTENRSTPVTVELIGPEIGDQVLVEGAPLMAVDYDPADKGDNLVITTGEEGQEHLAKAPREVWLARDELGRIEVIEVVDADGVRTLIRLNRGFDHAGYGGPARSAEQAGRGTARPHRPAATG